MNTDITRLINNIIAFSPTASSPAALQADKLKKVPELLRQSAQSAASRLGRHSAVMILASAAIFSPDMAFAEDSSDIAAENARLKEELLNAKKEAEALKKALAEKNQTVQGAEPAAVAAVPAAEPVAEAKVEEKKFESDQPKNLSEVTVTSRRKEEKLQEVPIPIAVIGGEQMKRDNIVSVQDMARRVPNLGVTSANSRQTSIALRGLGKNSGNEAMESSVGTQVDNVWNAWVGSTWTNYADIDHVEVLRGPQGTLQGKNSNLGLINIVTKTPSFKASQYIEGFGGSRDALQGKAAATGPIIPGLLAYRGSIYVDRRDGFIQNLDTPITAGNLQETNSLGGRMQFLLTPSDTLSARFIVDRSSSTQSMSVSPLISDPSKYSDGVNRSISFSSRLGRDWFDYIRKSGQTLYVMGDPRKVALDNKQVSRGDQEGVSGEINWEVGGHKLTSISAFRDSLFEPHHDGDNSTANIMYIGGVTVKQRQLSQEFRIASTEPGFIDYQGGIFAMHNVADTFNQNYFGNDAGAFYANAAQYTAMNSSGLSRQVMQSALNGVMKANWLQPVVDSYAGYGQANLHFTDQATLTLGVRDTYEVRKNIGYNNYVGGVSTADLTAMCSDTSATGLNTGVTGLTSAACLANAKAIRSTAVGQIWAQGTQGFGQNSQNWLVNPSYKFSKDFMAYFSVAGGQKSGAAQFNSTSGVVQNVKPEDVMDFELGVKTTWLDRKLAVNLNLYNTDIEGFQSQLVVPDATATTGYTTVLGNIKGIQLRGVELETNYNVTPNLSLFMNGSYNHAIYTDFKNAPCPAEIDPAVAKVCDQTGMTIPNAPAFTANFGFDYRHPFGLGFFQDYGLQWHAFLVDSYKSAANFNSSLSSVGHQDAYHVTDGGIGIATKNGQYNLDLVGRNFFDTIYVTNVTSFTNNAASSATYGEARYFGVHFRANY